MSQRDPTLSSGGVLSKGARLADGGAGGGSRGEGSRGGAVGGLARALERVRARARARLLVLGLAWLLAAAVGAGLALILFDYVVRMPRAMRGVIWLGGLAALAWGWVKLVAPGVRFRPALTEVALRLERSEAGRRAGLEGVLAAGLELGEEAGRGGATAMERGLALRVAKEAVARFSPSMASEVFAPGRVRRALACATAAVVAAGAWAAAQPELARLGSLRLAAPWMDLAWPKRTEVVSATAQAVHAVDAALPLRAVVTRTDRGPGRTDVWVNYRLLIDGRAGVTQRALMTAQQQRAAAVISTAAELTGQAVPVAGEMYERLIEPAGLLAGLPQREAGAVPAQLEYWFQTSDDRTPTAKVALVERPGVVRAEVTVEPPDYASGAGARSASGAGGAAVGEAGAAGGGARSGGGEAWWSGTRAVAIGERGAMLGPILAGSKVRLRLELNKPVGPEPVVHDEVDERDQRGGDDEAREPGPRRGLADAAVGAPRGGDVGGDEAGSDEAGSDEAGGDDVKAVPEREFTAVHGAGEAWSIEWRAERGRRMRIGLTDQYGLSGPDDAVFAVDVLADQSPAATVVEPARDESVLPTAVLEVVGEGRDDIGVSWVAVEYERAGEDRRPDAGAAGDQEGQRLEVEAVEEESAKQRRVTGVLDLSELRVKPGEEVRVRAVVKDIYRGGGGRDGAAEHDEVRSTPRRLRIITESELVEQLQTELTGVRQSAIRLDREQGQIAEQMERLGADGAGSAELRRRQASVGESLRPQAQAVERLRARAERNGLNDHNLELMLESAAAIVARAGGASSAAAGAMERAAQRPSEAGPASEEARAAQQSVRDELGRLIDLLESGKDGWAVRRSIEKLLAEQKELSARSKELGSQTVGKDASELTPAQRDALNRLAQQQRETAAKAGSAMDQMLSRAQQMKGSDPAQAEAMMQAARQAQERGLQEAMQQAAEELAKNKTQTGAEYQEQAEEALGQMLQEMESSQARREEVLRRVLGGLIASIEDLIKRQQGDIEALGRMEKVGVEALGKSMIDLRGRTLAVAEEARGGGRDMAKVAGKLGTAGESQAAAITALRAAPVDAGTADAMERTSLDQLREALAEAKKLEEQADRREQARRRAELRQAYGEGLMAQRALRAKAAEHLDKPLSRRERAVLRGLGDQQEAQRKKMEELGQKSEELKEAQVFQFAHRRLNEVLTRAARSLSEGEMVRATAADMSSAERMLESLMDALKEDAGSQEFSEGGDGGGGGGGGGGGEKRPAVPPIAELKLLRLIQQELAVRTREAEAAAGAERAASIERLGKDQDELTKQARSLIERMKQDQREEPVGGVQ